MSTFGDSLISKMFNLKQFNFTKIFEANYGPLNKTITSDIQRWNIIPFLDLHSRIDSISLNILPQMLYLFQCLSIPIPQKTFVESNRMLSKYIWKGKNARVKYKTLQLKKDKGGGAFFVYENTTRMQLWNRNR